MKKETGPYVINSISEQHRLLSLPKPQHPLISVFRYEDIKYNTEELSNAFIMNFFCVALKRNFKGKLKYGQNYYDFDEGVMSFISPNQLLSATTDDSPTEGYCLLFHPSFIAHYPLGKTIKNFGFFSYAFNEALHLSEKEEDMVIGIFKSIAQEYAHSIDTFSQDVMVSHIELLLNYCNRFYARQFITRKSENIDILSKMETLLMTYYREGEIKTLPTVQYVAGSLNVSADYLSDMLRNLTGQTTQQHIHEFIINRAKEKLSTTKLPVSEIAYQLGFEYPQSFNKLFKNKTNLSPLVFRNSFN
ncbi:helix-turn-helix transcriptional regulator [Mucilaginibacter sp. KACC 22773]|uniref:helix-turn-helix domain-containing protein n=1 Tax=Mucilaginibacter sp. KACC 22773 TaxID=3025671 RepID=UPI0023653D37|nr:helix-turn-helix transcriptional regulator [Mucilaginibacter sp. KACC 22773]WDF77098.1 helix-turn-helix transcriptional regulator [Mucilaginibacter sp. KACC 22773]